MNRTLSDRQIDAAPDVLCQRLIAIRLSPRQGDLDRCVAIADALHNIPEILLTARG